MNRTMTSIAKRKTNVFISKTSEDNMPMFPELNLLIQVIADKYGFKVNGKRTDFLKKIIQERMRINTFINPKDYVLWILANVDHVEWQKLINQLTVKETYFFRNKRQFTFLEDNIITELIRKRSTWSWKEVGVQLPKIRVLSAGCSTGEEPYSIAISLADKIKYLRSWDIRIDAYDISNGALEKARRGCYFPTDRMNDSLCNMNPEYLDKYFEIETDRYVIKKEIKDLVRFKQGNLKKKFEYPESFLPKYDIIFCRNVMIYFSFQDQKSLVKMLEKSLNPGGYLMMGDSEILHLYEHALRLLDLSSGLIYQKVAG